MTTVVASQAIRIGLVIGGMLIALSLAVLAPVVTWAADTDQIALGKRVYNGQCARCHGVNLEGQADWEKRKPDGKLPAPPHDATGHTWHHSDAQLFRITKEGPGAIMPGYVTDMPGFADKLSDDEIRAVLESKAPGRNANKSRRRPGLKRSRAPSAAA